jgi:hypothetical protein
MTTATFQATIIGTCRKELVHKELNQYYEQEFLIIRNKNNIFTFYTFWSLVPSQN